MTETKEKMLCSICNEPILTGLNGWAYGHNAEPINDGRCCDVCNTTKVIPERIRRIADIKDGKAPA